jgi:hypothetical protein
MDASKEQWTCQTRRPTCSPEVDLPRHSWGTEMRREDLMNPDLLSEIVLLGSAAVIVVALLLIVVAALTQPTALA